MRFFFLVIVLSTISFADESNLEINGQIDLTSQAYLSHPDDKHPNAQI